LLREISFVVSHEDEDDDGGDHDDDDDDDKIDDDDDRGAGDDDDDGLALYSQVATEGGQLEHARREGLEFDPADVQIASLKEEKLTSTEVGG
jgi:hypothetical protein